ncbi:MAG TPA: hypothetical protein VL240_06145 [Candidatus Binatia bacterium]|nr:hypothetical protein [Candidatus Binatia bacterium]
MARLASLAFVLACMGFAAVLTIHIAALSGSVGPFQHFGKLLFPALLVVWLPAIFCMNRLVRDVPQKDIWKAALRGCPTWMRTALWVVCGYAWVGGFVIPIIAGRDTNSQLAGARTTSGVMLGFYGIAVCVLLGDSGRQI